MRAFRGVSQVLCGLALLAILVLVPLHVKWGAPSYDEGWYSCSALLAAQGERPYADFFFTQTPSSLAVYGMAYRLLGRDLAHGRQAAALFLGLGLAVGLAATWRRGGPAAAFLFLGLAGLNPFTLHMGTLVLTTAFEVFLLVAIGVVLLDGLTPGRLLVGLCLAALLTTFRLSYVTLLPVLWILGATRFRTRPRWMAAHLVLPLAILAASLGPALAAAGPDRFLFDTVGYHLSWAGRTSGIVFPLEAKRAFLADLGAYYFPEWALLIAAIPLWRRLPAEERPSLLSAGLVLPPLAAHLMVAVPFAKYETASMVVLALPIALTLAASLSRVRRAAPALLVAAPLLASGGLAYRSLDRESPQPPTRYPALVARKIDALTGGRPVLTLDSVLQFAGVNAVPGFSMDIFSIIPDADEATCARHGVTNLPQLLGRIESPGADYLALRMGYEFGLGLRRNALLTEAVNRHFVAIAQFPRYGQYRQDLILLRRRAP